MTNAVITPISDVDYNLKVYQKFKRTMINAARSVPYTTGDGDNGNIFLLESVATYTAYMDGTGYIKAMHPGNINVTRATTNTQISHVKETRATALETYQPTRRMVCMLTSAIHHRQHPHEAARQTQRRGIRVR